MLSFYLQFLETDQEKQRFEEIHNQNKDLMYHVANKILNHIEDTEDAVHHAFVKLLEIWKKIEHQTCPQITSLCVIISRNAAIDIARKKKYRVYTPLEEIEWYEDSNQRTDDEVLEKMGVETIMQCILQLPEIVKDSLMLHIGNGLSVRQVAKLLNISTEAAKKRIQRGRSQLVTMMKGEYANA